MVLPLLLLVAARENLVAHAPQVQLAFTPTDAVPIVSGFLTGSGLADEACIAKITEAKTPVITNVGTALTQITTITEIDIIAIDKLDTGVEVIARALEELPQVLQVCSEQYAANEAKFKEWIAALQNHEKMLQIVAGLAAIPNLGDKIAAMKAAYGSSDADAAKTFGTELGLMIATVGTVAARDVDWMKFAEGIVRGLGLSATFSGEACRTAAEGAQAQVYTAVNSLMAIETSLEVSLDGAEQTYDAFKKGLGELGAALNALPTVLGSCGSAEAEAQLKTYVGAITDPAKILKVVASLFVLPNLEQRLELARAAFASGNIEKLGEDLGQIVKEVGQIANAQLDWTLVHQGLLAGLGVPNLKTCIEGTSIHEDTEDFLAAMELIKEGSFRSIKNGLRKLLSVVPGALRIYLTCRTAAEADIQRLRDIVVFLETPGNWETVLRNVFTPEAIVAVDDAVTAYEGSNSESFGESFGDVVNELTGLEPGDHPIPGGGTNNNPPGGGSSGNNPTPAPSPAIPGGNPNPPDEGGGNGGTIALLVIVIVGAMGGGYLFMKKKERAGNPRAATLSQHHNRF